MFHKSSIRILILLGCCLLEASTRPSDELQSPVTKESSKGYPQSEIVLSKEGKIVSTTHEKKTKAIEETSTKDILDKIKKLNKNLNKQTNTQSIHNSSPNVFTNNEANEETLKKISELIISGKLQPFSIQKLQENNYLTEEDKKQDRDFNSRALQATDMTQNNILNNQLTYPYLTSLPILVIPTQSYSMKGYSNKYNGDPLETNSLIQTRVGSTSFPGQFQWPFAQYFPILIKDPLLGLMHGGGWQNFVEYGQQADVCSRKHKSLNSQELDNDIDVNKTEKIKRKSNEVHSRRKRDITKSSGSLKPQIQKIKKFNKIFTIKPVTTTKPLRLNIDNTLNKNNNDSEEDGDSRLPFGDFTLFGNKKPVVPSPGFFINKLKVRRGGVAIAGPGGVATAGRGGTAIVGPGGLAYTQPGGVAVAGPSARVIALGSDVDLNSVVHRLQEQAAADRSVRKLLEAIPEGKHVATGPVVYYNPDEELYWGPAWNRNRLADENIWKSIDDPKEFVNPSVPISRVKIRPFALAVSGLRGLSIAHPISQVVIDKKRSGIISHDPMISAITGPGGIAHAQSDLYIYEYIPKEEKF